MNTPKQINVVFEYSFENKSFDKTNPKHRKILESIYNNGASNYQIHTMITESNELTNSLAQHFTWLLHFIEHNTDIFFQYAQFLLDNKVITIEQPKENTIVKDRNLLEKYYKKEKYILTTLELLECVFKHVININKGLHIKKSNETQLEAFNTSTYFRFILNKNELDKLDEEFINKLSVAQNKLFNLPLNIIFEIALPAFCSYMTHYNLNKLNVSEKNIILNFFTYELGLA